MTTSNIQGHIYGLIEEIAASEKITKLKLALISRDILAYVMDTNDIAAVNRLIGVLTPVNKRVSILYFKAMLPWEHEADTDGVFTRFGKKTKGEKRLAKCQADMDAFLSDPDNNIWTWAEANVEVEAKKKDFGGMIQRTVEQALKGDEKSDTPAIDPMAVIQAVFAGGVNLEDVLLAIEVEQKKKEAAEELQDAVEAAIAEAVAEAQAA